MSLINRRDSDSPFTLPLTSPDSPVDIPSVDIFQESTTNGKECAKDEGIRESVQIMTQISNPEIKALVTAIRINSKKIELKSLNLPKEDIIRIAPYLTYLDCRGCFDEKWEPDEIYFFLESCSQHVKTLIIDDRVKMLPVILPACETLICCHCKKLAKLPELPNCRNLDCSYCINLNMLPSLPVCEILNCNFCVKLSELPELNSCEILNCKYCPNISTLPPLPLCEFLDCSCNDLTRILGLPKCINLNCNDNKNLIKLPLLPVCQYLYCQKCTRLSSLPSLPKCQILFCEECINLTKFSSLPLCENLFCNGCLSLLEFPQLPMCDQLFYDVGNALDIDSVPFRFRPWQEIGNEIILQIRVTELMRYPLNVLFKLRDFVFERGFMPKIQYIENDGRISKGIDVGGVSRNFVSRLMQSLIFNSVKGGRLSFKEMDSGLYIPFFNPKDNLKVQIKAFQIMGSLLDLCLWNEEPYHELTIGIVFDREFFQIIHTLSYEDLERIDPNLWKIPLDINLKLIANSTDPYLSKTGKLLLKPLEDLKFEELEILRQTILNGIDAEEEKMPEDFYPPNFHKQNLLFAEMKEMASWISENVKRLIVIDSELKYLPAIIIALELKKRIGTKDEHERLLSFGVEYLEKKIQGVLNREAILKAIQYKEECQNLDPGLIEKTKLYINQWIQEASLIDLMNLNSFITGSPTLKESRPLNFVLNAKNANNLPSSRSCFSSFNITINYPDYITFKNKLDIALKNVNNIKTSGFEDA